MEFYVFTCLRFKILIIKNDSLIDLLIFYLTTKEVVLFETTLDKMVTLTTLDNYLKVIDYIDSSPNSIEIDLSM